MQSDSVENYIALERFSLLYDHYAFIDALEYHADRLFIEHRVTVRFGHEYRHPDKPYVIILCRVRKRDRAGFLAALGEMHRKMILCGYPGYAEFCGSFLEQMNGGVKALHEKRCGSNEACSAEEAEQARSKSAS